MFAVRLHLRLPRIGNCEAIAKTPQSGYTPSKVINFTQQQGAKQWQQPNEDHPHQR